MTNESSKRSSCPTTFTQRALALSLLAYATCAVGCGATPDVGEQAATTEQELGEATCLLDPVAGDLRLRADGAWVLSPGVQGVVGDARRVNAPYNDPTCFMAAKVAIDGGVGPDPGQPVPVGSTLQNPVHIWVAPSSLPSNPTDCAATTARAILYGHRFQNGQEINFQINDVHSYAHWEAGLNVCEINWIDLGHPTGGSGVPYHVGVTVRRNGVTQPVLVVATQRALPPDDRGLCAKIGNCIKPRN